MRIAAIYIEHHDYLFDAPQTINFGTKYFYSFEKENDNVNISRTINKNFIPNFFDSTNLGSKLTNINAIVGQNGAGKSTLLDIIRSVFIDNTNALPHAKSLFLYESNDSGKPFILKNDFGKVVIKERNNKEIELNESSNQKIKSIYYSPHYDYKYNLNFDNIDNHDISFDKIVEDDLKELGEKDTNQNGLAYSASQELVFKNSLRQIYFLSSDLVKKQNIFKDLFHLQNHYEPILYFRGYKGEVKEHNTPYQLRSILTSIADKAEKESSAWYLYRNKRASQVQINQYLLKRNVIKCILSVIYKQLEKSNSFLEEGDFPYDKLNKQLEKADSYKALIMFAKYGAIKIQPGKSENIFKKNILEKLLKKYTHR
ncbi:hypothetical protein FAES_3370 [Fibrella aestuarina BUZ 2]|uniref:Uncharacterized protein n=1 Tax=Fibrella aestuarina BUZ 2 TaxID=1166018 RepID=I0KB75_9BACT|nr:ATP-binding cassette domain-containing protein [Fibrella aestuarina]CCH01378.1 hypothetical protein FAES_3370 [Fibrella aestuarina BUZ 2]